VPSNDQTPCGQTGALSAEMADHHSGPVGPKHNSGVPKPQQASVSPSPHLSTEHKGGSSQEGSYRGNNPVLFEPVPGPQEGWGATTSNKPQGSESMEEIHNLKYLLQPGGWLHCDVV